MQKVILVTSRKRKEIEDFMTGCLRDEESFDYIEYCASIGEKFGIKATDAERISDDLFVNSSPEWECYDSFDVDNIHYDPDGDFHYVED